MPKRKPNKANIRKWVDALRSGDYAQAKGALRKDIVSGETGFCCLGVACEISPVVKLYQRSGVSKAVRLGYKSVDDDDDRSTSVLPDAAAKWLGLNNAPDVAWDDSPTGRSSLTVLNDAEGCNFSQIADAIEAEYLAA